jgi:hypothetical protein
MLWLAIWQRVSQYGVTERRYFLTILSVWLAGIAVYYTVRGSRRIIAIPASLCILGLATFVGPWSAYATARRSQAGRLETLLTQHGLVNTGSVQPADEQIPYLDRREISAVVRYLLEAHGTRPLTRWFDEASLAAVDTTDDSGDDGTGPASRRVDARARRLVAQLGVGYVERWQRGTEERFDFVAASSLEAVPIAGYDYAFEVDRGAFDCTPEPGTMRMAWDSARAALRLIHADGGALEIPLGEAIRRAVAHRQLTGERMVPRDSLRVIAEDRQAQVAVHITSIAGRRTAEGPVLSSVAAGVYVRVK